MLWMISGCTATSDEAVNPAKPVEAAEVVEAALQPRTKPLILLNPLKLLKSLKSLKLISPKIAWSSRPRGRWPAPCSMIRFAVVMVKPIAMAARRVLPVCHAVRQVHATETRIIDIYW